MCPSIGMKFHPNGDKCMTPEEENENMFICGEISCTCRGTSTPAGVDEDGNPTVAYENNNWCEDPIEMIWDEAI